MNTLHERLDVIARTYDTTADFDRYSNEFARKLIGEQAFGRDLLEVGCGWGDMTEHFAPDFRRIVALDGSWEFVSRTRERCRLYPHVEIHHSLVEEFQTANRFEDIVIAHVLEHVDEPVETLAKLASLLQPDGQVHIVVPNSRSLHRRIGKAMGLLRELDEFSARDIQLCHMRVYDLPLLNRHIEAAGLRTVGTDGIMIKPLSNGQMQAWDPAVINALLEVGRDEPDLCNELYLRTVKR